MQVHDAPAGIMNCRLNSDSAGAPVGVPVRVSNPTRRAAVVVPCLVIETVIAVEVTEAADNERNWSRFGVVVDVTYSAGMVYVARKVSFVVAAPSRGDGGARAVSSTQTLSPGGVPQLGRPRFSSP